MNEPKLVLTAVHLPPDLRQQVFAAAAADDRSVSSLIRVALREKFGDAEPQREAAEGP